MFTVVAIEDNRCIDQLINIEKYEIPVAVAMFRRDYTHSTVIVEDKTGRVIQVHKIEAI